MRRSSVTPEDVADWDNLSRAAHRASLGKRHRREVWDYLSHLDTNLAQLRHGIVDGTVEVGRATSFHIRDPKPRVIHAPCFRERVLHHALMNRVGPVLERSLVDDTFACCKGRGTLAAVHRCQQHVRRFLWYAKMDVRQYFASIDHGVLKQRLARKFKSRRLLQLFGRIIDAHSNGPGHGLPIGSLTSQCFANFYLGGLDRFLLEDCRVRGIVRYMDDFIFWGDSRREVAVVERASREFLFESLRLTAKPDQQINRSSSGVTLCGFRIFPGTIRLAASRRRRFRLVKRRWERAWLEGRIDARQLQRGYDAARAIVIHADAGNWRGRLESDSPNWHDDV